MAGSYVEAMNDISAEILPGEEGTGSVGMEESRNQAEDPMSIVSRIEEDLIKLKTLVSQGR